MMGRLYDEVAHIIRQASLGQGSLRSLAFAARLENKKQVYCLCCKIMQYLPALKFIVAECNLLEEDAKLFMDDEYLAYVITFELLFGKPSLSDIRVRMCKRNFKRVLLAAKQKAETAGLLDLSGAESQQSVIPRYGRANLLRCNMDDVLSSLRDIGWLQVETPSKRKPFLSTIDGLAKDQFCIDLHMPDEILCFPSNTDFHSTELYQAGHLLLQDKSSCLASTCLAPTPGSNVVDVCAAPGMKTSHLAALMQNRGKLFAVDINAERVTTMQKMLERAGVSCAYCINEDFLKLDLSAKQFRKIEYALVDPPCTGSGMVNRPGGAEYSEQRLNALGNVQAMLLKHALSGLPKLKRLVYSTCSVHVRENEEVIQETLRYLPDGMQLVHALPAWKHRGKKQFPFGKLCLRASPHKDRTNGFFVAVFERI